MGKTFCLTSNQIRNRTTLALGCLILVCAIGCSTFRYAGAPPPSYDIEGDLKQLSEHFKPAVAISNYYVLGTNATINDRNAVIAGRLVMINLEYLKWLRTVNADKQLLDSASDILILSINLAATATGGATAKTILSAISAGVAGSKTAIDKHYYYEKTLPALLAAMNAQRKSVLTNILSGMSKPLAAYPFEQALADIQEYYQAGTLMGAVTAVQADSGAKEKEADKGVKQAQVELTKVRTAESVLAAIQLRISGILEKIGKLPDAVAIDLEKKPPVQDAEVEKVIALRDPANQRLTDGKVAKQMLKMRATLSSNRSEKDLAAWEAALKSLE